MNNKSISIPFGMIFGRYYCSKCGAKLKKEKTHRVVSKDDKDYYNYHDLSTFPRRDCDVYDYRFKCPSCEARISYEEQRIIKQIQKKENSRVLSSVQIKQSYEESKEHNSKGHLLRRIVTLLVTYLLAFIIIYFKSTDKAPRDLAILSAIFCVAVVFSIIRSVRRFKGKYKFKHNGTYSYEKQRQMEKLHAYSSHNRALTDASQKCYCFHCQCIFDSRDIKEYTDDGKTALCPVCDVDSVIPDSVDEAIDQAILSDMHKYWF